MDVYENLMNRRSKLAVIGLGYVGMPIAIAFAKQVEVIGFDIDKEKIARYETGIDPTNEVGNEVIKQTTMTFTTDENQLKEANFFIVAVPTPISADETPDLEPVKNASLLLGRQLKKGSIVVYESTVYPGVTEDICVPILEKASGLTCGPDFKVGYSPERINPGDKVQTLEKIKKVVSGIDQESLAEIAKVYELVIEAGVHLASSIKVAEAAKVAENSQRDINIAFMNELAVIFDPMDIDTKEVVDAMNTKWNALGFYPGLVGGHCIGVDPYYLIHKAKELGHSSQVIAMGRKMNEEMDEFISDMTIKKLILANKVVSGSKVAILGLTFKENCPDTRNSKVINIVNRLREYHIEPLVVDPVADAFEVKSLYDIDLVDIQAVKAIDCLILAVAHDAFKAIDFDQMDALFENAPGDKIMIDVKSVMDKQVAEARGYVYWRL
ncbi:MAG: nucleotide sugar dehydrogenase [Defluviitaleaceae bacterium]|nr:nucleotide sugar dehydrogenase [Defluviitaleaceae bacterium]